MKGWRKSTILDLSNRAVAHRRKKAAVQKWLDGALAGDAVLGRGDHNWAAAPAAAFQPILAGMKARGLSVYVGSGQAVVADLKPHSPVLIQRRPLAQRTVTLALLEGATA